MTYAELAAVRGTSQPSAERLARRRGWPRQVGNDGVVRVLVPLAEARNISTSAASGVASVTLRASPPVSPGQMTPNDRGLRGAIQTLREQLANADQREESERRRAERAEHELALTNNSLVSERDRAEEMERHVNELMAERRQAQASPPDVRSVIKEVIREIAGAAPPDDRDDRETLRTLESAIAALQAQVEHVQSGFVAERQRAEQAEHRLEVERQRIDELQTLLTEGRRLIDTLHIDLADARTDAMISGSEAAALRAQADERRGWRLLRRLRWALRGK
jgi:chromosome segregation ATPase